MSFVQIILYPFSLLYGMMMSLRNGLFDANIKKVESVDAKVISIGNLSVGGTGKTPHVEFFAEKFYQEFKVAILLRGYGRKTKGFFLVNENSTFLEVGDEALTYYRKFNDSVVVAVCEKRVDGAKNILKLFPDVQLIILDDALQHRYIHRDINVVLTEYNNPYFKDFILPAGRLREFKLGIKRADICIVTKTIDDINSSDYQSFKDKIHLNDERIFFSKIEYGQLIDMKLNEVVKVPENILLLTGIANPTPLYNYLSKSSKVIHKQFKDHHEFTAEDLVKIHKIIDTFVGDIKIVTTEKDAMRILNSDLNDVINEYPWCYQEMKINIREENKLLDYVYGVIKNDE